MAIDIHIDNNVWDLLFDLRLDLCAELPRGEFRLLVTREGEMEVTAIPERRAELRAFIEATTARCGVEVDGHFGFRDDSLPPEGQRTMGFGLGRFITEDERGFAAQTPWRSDDPPRKPEVKLRRNDTDVALAARSFVGVVLTLDAKPGALADARRQGGRVVFLKRLAGSGMTLRAFIEAALWSPVDLPRSPLRDRVGAVPLQRQPRREQPPAVAGVVLVQHLRRAAGEPFRGQVAVGAAAPVLVDPLLGDERLDVGEAGAMLRPPRRGGLHFEGAVPDRLPSGRMAWVSVDEHADEAGSGRLPRPVGGRRSC